MSVMSNIAKDHGNMGESFRDKERFDWKIKDLRF